MEKTETEVARLKVLQDKEAAHETDNSNPALTQEEQVELTELSK